MHTRPVAQNLFSAEPNGVHLIAARRKSDGKIIFPFPESGEREGLEKISLSRHGTLWTYTIQRFRPKAPFNGEGEEDEFQPYAVGYVELPGEVIVETRIVCKDLSQLRIGMGMQSIAAVYRTDENGRGIETYAFSPIIESELL